MNNNNLGRVAVRTSRRKKNPTPFHFDVNATMGVGEVTPFTIRAIDPGSSARVKTRDLIRLATMSVPTYGRLKLNLRHYFVGMSDLTDNFSALMAQQDVARGQYTFTPVSLPFLSKGILSLLCLVGSHVTLYRSVLSNDDVSDTSMDRLYKVAFGGSNPYPSSLVEWLSNPAWQNTGSGESVAEGELYTQHMPSSWQSAWNGYDGPALNIAKFIRTSWYSLANDAFWIPIENKCFESLFDCSTFIDKPASYYNFDVVGLDEGQSDCVVVVKQKGSSPVTNGVGHLACRFSNFGKRWYNALVASGIGFDTSDFTTSGASSIMPLFAYYKAYWESFGLTLYDKWETSSVVRMMRYFDDFNQPDFEEAIFKSSHSVTMEHLPPLFYEYFCNFVSDVGNAFYTEEQDFTSAHTRTPAVSSSNAVPEMVANSPTQGSKVELLDSSSEPPSPAPNVGGPWIQTGYFSQLDIETLKRMYKVVNRNTIAGQNIAKLLELQGLGDYVNSCKSRFIGSFDVDIDVDEVTATADAFDANGDAKSLLGEQGAKGIGFGVSKKYLLSNNEYGYYVILASIVPESGYVNCALAQAKALKKTDFYNPEFDGLGMELNTKDLVISGVQDFGDVSSDAQKLSSDAFGFLPRYSRHKVMTNLALGGFARRSRRGYYRQYMLDKVIDIGSRDVTEVESSHSSYREFQVVKTTKVSRVPCASPNWRFVGRYPWLENYLRIFAETGDPLRNSYVFYQSLVGFVSTFFDYTFADADKFIVQNRVIFDLSSPWLKITDAFETKEDGNVGSTDTSIGKA